MDNIKDAKDFTQYNLGYTDGFTDGYTRYMRDIININDDSKIIINNSVYIIRDIKKRLTPTKPIKIITDVNYEYYCPACNKYFGTQNKYSSIFFHKLKYCDCGQAIDWNINEKKT